MVLFAGTMSYLTEQGNHRAFESPKDRREQFKSMLTRPKNIDTNNINKYIQYEQYKLYCKMLIQAFFIFPVMLHST